MFGTQIDDPVTTTTPLKADPVVTGSKIHGFLMDPIRPPVDSRLCCLRRLVVTGTKIRGSQIDPIRLAAGDLP